MEALVRGAAALGIALDAGQIDQFARYRDLLLEWNARFNLTAITDPAEIVTRHFLDSLTVAQGLPADLRAGMPRVLDVGAGAGFPGLALAIAFPAWRVTLLEATGKKVRFLEAVIAEMGATNARTLTGRAEEVAHQPGQRGAYDVVTARAVASLPTLLEYCAPFAAVGGWLVLPKKGDLAAELAQGDRAAPRWARGCSIRFPARTRRWTTGACWCWRGRSDGARRSIRARRERQRKSRSARDRLAHGALLSRAARSRSRARCPRYLGQARRGSRGARRGTRGCCS